ncbi:MAG TPA: arginase family protein [Puia sp.]|nr:arginase family protein [Puia sp.]
MDITIFEFPSNLGLIEPKPGHEPGVKKLPDWLRTFHFHDILHPVKILTLPALPYSMHVDEESGIRNAEAIAEYAVRQSGLLISGFGEKSFSLVIGGDCSIIIGNTLCLKKLGNYGLFFLDGHTDYMWPELSGTKGAAGMDLAIVTGHCHPKLSNIEGNGPYMREENVYCVGNREYDGQYVKTIEDSDIQYFDLNSLRVNGIKKCCQSFLDMVEKKNLDGFWIHLDLDVLDDEQMPAVDSRTPGGLSYQELKEILTPLLLSKKSMGMEITILDPELDPDGVYTKVFVNEIAPLIKDKISESRP